MNYLYFDIECCDGNHICSLGYVLVNDKFEILDKKDILINPEHAFKLGRAGFDPKIHLAYKEEEFIKSPTFGEEYEEIKQILTRPNQTVLGHSSSSDLKYLSTAYKRYHKDRIKIDVYDTQKFFAKLTPNYQIRSLENILKDLQIDVTHLIPHKSCDDAEKSMLVAKEICKLKKIGIDELLTDNKDCVVNYKTIRLDYDKSRINKVLKSLGKTCNDSKEWKCFYFSQQIKMRDFEKRINLIKAVYQKGYRVTMDISQCSYIVINNIMNIKEKEWFEGIPKNERPKIISINEMSELLKIKINKFGEIEENSHKKDRMTSLRKAFDNARKSSYKQQKRKN